MDEEDVHVHVEYLSSHEAQVSSTQGSLVKQVKECMLFVRAELREYHVDLRWYSLIGIEEEFLGENSEVLAKGEDDRAYIQSGK